MLKLGTLRHNIVAHKLPATDFRRPVVIPLDPYPRYIRNQEVKRTVCSMATRVLHRDNNCIGLARLAANTHCLAAPGRMKIVIGGDK